MSRLCLGTNMFGADYVDDDRALSVIDEAQSRGINFIDTADVYFAGGSERVLGKALRGRRHEFVVATKGFMPTGPGPNERGLSRAHLLEAVEGSLRRLDTDYIDLYQVHFWDEDTPIQETLTVLDDLVHQGKVRYLGCSNFAAWQLCRALWVSDKHGLERFEAVQPRYNLSEREAESELFPLCEDQGLAAIPYQVLMGGLLTGAYKRGNGPPEDTHLASRHAWPARDAYWNDAGFALADSVASIAGEVGCEPSQLVVAWALSRPVVTSVIVGSSRPEQVAKNVAATELVLAPDVIEKLDAL